MVPKTQAEIDAYWKSVHEAVLRNRAYDVKQFREEQRRRKARMRKKIPKGIKCSRPVSE
jgi:hypothetical protein